MTNHPSSATIILNNHSGVTLSKFATNVSHGGVPTVSGYPTPVDGETQAVSVPDGTAVAVTVINSNGACEGAFAFTDAHQTVKFKVRYEVPTSDDDATVEFVPVSDQPSCIGFGDPGPGTLEGPDVEAIIDLYVGNPVQKWDDQGNVSVAGYTVPIADNPYEHNNARDAINSMFQANVRVSDVVAHWYDQDSLMPYSPADYSGGQLSGPSTPLMSQMLDLWPDIGTSTTPPDYQIISFLADFVVPPHTNEAPLVMYVPQIKYKGYDGHGDTQGPIYELQGYQAFPLAGADGARFNTDSVTTFLQLLLAGAHFVNIQASRDFQNLPNYTGPTNPGRDLYSNFKSTFHDNGDSDATSGRHSCTGNSHYAWGGPIVNTSGWYYGGQRGEWASNGCGLLLSLLFAQTADGDQYNTFMQLEGWPADTDWWNTGASVKGGDRHAADFDAYGKSLWNISTFGACPYSEKRATTIFLAPLPWVPTIHSDTYMMPYVGAETPQGWLRKSLVKLPS